MSCHEALLARKKRSRASKQHHQQQHKLSSSSRHNNIPISNSSTSLSNGGRSHDYGSPGSDSSKRSFTTNYRMSAIKDKSLPSIPNEAPLQIPDEPPAHNPRRSGIHIPDEKHFSFSSTPSVNSLQFENQTSASTITQNDPNNRLGEFLPIQLDAETRSNTASMSEEDDASSIIIKLDSSSSLSLNSDKQHQHQKKDHSALSSSLNVDTDSLHTAKSSASSESGQLQPALEISDEIPYKNGRRSPSPAPHPDSLPPRPPRPTSSSAVDQLEKTQSDPNDLDALIPERSDLRNTSTTPVIRPSTPIKKKGSTDLKRSPRSPSLKSARSIRSSKSSSSPSGSPTTSSAPADQGKSLTSPMISLPKFQPSPGNTLSEDLTPFLMSQNDDSMENIYINTSTPPRSPRANGTRRPTPGTAPSSASKTLSPNSAVGSSTQQHNPPKSPRETLAAAAASIDRLDAGLSGVLTTTTGEQGQQPKVATAGDSEPVITSKTLTKELVDSKKKIVELERLLSKRGNDDASPQSHVESLKKELKEKRMTIAGLEAEGLVAKEELKVLNEAKENKFTNVEEMMSEFEKKVADLKEKFTKEITELVNERNDLKEKLDELEKARSKAAEESTLLNIKNTQLVDMNNELTKQMIEKFGNQQDAKLPNSGSLTNLESHTPQSAGSSSMLNTSSQPSSNHVSTPSQGGTEEPMVTILDKPQVVDTRKDRQHARRFWKRPGHAVAKGLNKVFENNNNSNANTPNLPPSNSYSSVTDLTQSSGSTDNGGLGITFPNKDNTNSTNTNGTNNSNNNNNKPARNGWFNKTSSTEHSNSSNGSLTTHNNEPNPESTLMGVPIDKRISLEGTKVPTIVTKCIEEVEKRGLEFEGIYRKSGGKSQITSIEEVFEKCQETKYEEVLAGDICGVTSVVKQYLRYLPIPLITYDIYEDFIHVCDGKDTTAHIAQMRTVITKLPPAYRDCLETITRHLAKVTEYSDKNRMTSKNLSVVFAPTLARHQTGEREIMDMQARNDSTQLLIDNYDAIFNGF
ncbi:hypothetical protein TRICI_003323 [Trichomonascus ciferrii]|uniref:Rho-GAP domain-containing protein n=1 Tax=Trichomonascus ciferrii TaxID=44093 RepID=A0A642V5E4_9ASCO|nr:hypothetical protein TRICI_003323 [Trichomonascus ciferrii]